MPTADPGPAARLSPGHRLNGTGHSKLPQDTQRQDRASQGAGNFQTSSLKYRVGSVAPLGHQLL